MPLNLNRQVSAVSPNFLEYSFSFQQDTKLLMLHSSEHSMQWGVNSVGIMLQVGTETFRVCIMSNQAPSNYMGFTFKIEDYPKVYKFFEDLDFPLHGSPNPNEE